MADSRCAVPSRAPPRRPRPPSSSPGRGPRRRARPLPPGARASALASPWRRRATPRRPGSARCSLCNPHHRSDIPPPNRSINRRHVYTKQADLSIAGMYIHSKQHALMVGAGVLTVTLHCREVKGCRAVHVRGEQQRREIRDAGALHPPLQQLLVTLERRGVQCAPGDTMAGPITDLPLYKASLFSVTSHQHFLIEKPPIDMRSTFLIQKRPSPAGGARGIPSPARRSKPRRRPRRLRTCDIHQLQYSHHKSINSSVLV